MINLADKFTTYVDEVFTTESKKSLLTNNDFSWSGAHTIKAQKVNTVAMTDYDRDGKGKNASRYGELGTKRRWCFPELLRWQDSRER